MILPAPFEFAGEQMVVSLPGAQALFTTRRGGSSRGAYESFNLGYLTDDDPAAVRANRERLGTLAGAGLAHGLQVHGARVQRRQRPNAEGELEEADGQATAVPGVAPMVLGADCVTIVIAGGGAVAAVHAGWRGLAAGVIDAGVTAVRELGTGPAAVRKPAADREPPAPDRGARAELAAAIGPAAGVCCYEVGEEVHAEFAAYGPAIRRGRNLDLKAIAAVQLRRAGVDAVHDIGLCTLCAEPGLLFSHRRDGGVTGRQAAVAWLT